MIIVTYVLLALLVLEALFNRGSFLSAIVAGLIVIIIHGHKNQLGDLNKKVLGLEKELKLKSNSSPSSVEENQRDTESEQNRSTKADATSVKPDVISAKHEAILAEATPDIARTTMPESLPESSQEDEKHDDTNELPIQADVSPTIKTGDASDNAKDENLRSTQEQAQAVSKISSEQNNKKVAEPKPSLPAEPDFIEELMRKVFDLTWGWVTGGNPFVRVGMILLFMGMSFLIRYAIGEGLIPIEVRLLTVAIFALGLLYLGWRKRDSRKNFALVLQGGGIGLLYLTVFAGFSLYGVLPSLMSFALLGLIVLLSTFLAIQQDAKPLALFATIGGFLAPVLTSSGNNNYVGLFSYYALLNIGIFAVAWFKSWRILNFVGFLFTFLISTTWGVLRYQPENFLSTEPFLVFYFLLYVAIGILYAYKRVNFHKDYVDGSIIFGTPIFVFGLQSAMVQHIEYGVAISAACLGVFYVALATLLWNKYAERLKLLTETFLSLGVIFLTLAIPFAIDGKLTGAAWAIEGAGILWLSIKQQHRLRRLFGAALIFLAGVMLFYGLFNSYTNAPIDQSKAFINSFFIGCVLIAIAASIASYLLSTEFKGRLKFEALLVPILLVYAIIILFVGFKFEIKDFYLTIFQGPLLALLSTVAVLSYSLFSKRFSWYHGHIASTFFILPIFFAALLSFLFLPQLAFFYGYLLWPVVITVAFFGLKNARQVLPSWLSLIAHIVLAITVVGLLFWEGLWQLMLVYGLLAVLFNYLTKKFEWPELKLLSVAFLPVLLVCGVVGISSDGNLVDLSNLASTIYLPFKPGVFLWPFSFAVYFYIIQSNRSFAGDKHSYLHYAGAALIGALLFWLGLAPLLLGASVLSIVFCFLWKKLPWPEMRVMSIALLPVMLLVFLHTIFIGDFDIGSLSGIDLSAISPTLTFEAALFIWPLSFLVLFWTYRQFDNAKQSAQAIWQGLSLLLLNLVITWEVSWNLLDYLDVRNAWHLAWVPVVSLILLLCIAKATIWPFNKHQQDYRRFSVPALAIGLVLWSIFQLSSSGIASPLPWIPVLNPLDLMQIMILLATYTWFEHLLPPFIAQRLSVTDKQEWHTHRVIIYAVLVGAFVWANVDLLRAIHHWTGIAWQFPTLLLEDLSQTVLSLFWALCGLGMTVFSSRKNNRVLWFCGASLLVLVVLKLMLIDMSAQETIERIISFTGVGILLVAVGYFSPLPPKKEELGNSTIDENSKKLEGNSDD